MPAADFPEVPVGMRSSPPSLATGGARNRHRIT
jgi:hypothetical protein